MMTIKRDWKYEDRMQARAAAREEVMTRGGFVPVDHEEDCGDENCEYCEAVAAKQFRIFTWISGGVTGRRSSYMKLDDQELRFETKEKAEEYVEDCKRIRSKYSTFTQGYAVEEV